MKLLLCLMLLSACGPTSTPEEEAQAALSGAVRGAVCK